MATHSSILAWRIPWTEEPGRLRSMGLQESDMTERLNKVKVVAPLPSLLPRALNPAPIQPTLKRTQASFSHGAESRSIVGHSPALGLILHGSLHHSFSAAKGPSWFAAEPLL